MGLSSFFPDTLEWRADTTTCAEERQISRQWTIKRKMADQKRSNLDVVFTIILCATNVFIW